MQIILGKVDALQLAAGDGQITRYGTAGTKGDRIELFQQCFRRNFVADLTVQFKGDPGLFQKLDASFYQMLCPASYWVYHTLKVHRRGRHVHKR